jgi:glycosyltransferase involved in cell wall biosynthesis
MRLVTVMHGQGHHQRAICPPNNAYAARVQALGVDVVSLDLPGTFAFMDRRKIAAELRRSTPDIVMSWTADAAALVEPGGYVHVGRAMRVHDAPRWATCKILLAPSQARADAAISAGRDAASVRLIPHLPSAVLNTQPPAPFDRKKNFTPATARLVFTAARLDIAKGIEDLFEAMTKLSGLYLWIAGDGAYREVLEEQAYTLGIKPRVRFLGWQDDLRPYFAAADVFVYPARQEDLGDAIVEAWSAGAAIVATDSLGPGLLIRNQENGLLIPVGDSQALADAIKFVLVEKEMARRLSAGGRSAFDENFSPDKLIARYVAFFDGLVAPLTSS